MPFLAIKKNPFDEVGKRWAGAGARAPQAAKAAAEAATQVLVATVQERAQSMPRWDERLTSHIGMVDGPQVGLVGASLEDQERAIAAEYGDEENGPQALMRTSTTRARARAEEVFNETFQSRLWGG